MGDTKIKEEKATVEPIMELSAWSFKQQFVPSIDSTSPVKDYPFSEESEGKNFNQSKPITGNNKLWL